MTIPGTSLFNAELFVTIQRPDADNMGIAACRQFFQESASAGSKSAGSWKCAPARFGMEALDFVVKIVGDRIDATPIVKSLRHKRFPPPSRS